MPNNNLAESAWLQYPVPEAPLAELTRKIQPFVTGDAPSRNRLVLPEVARQRSAIAAQWVQDLHKVLKRWNGQFISLLKLYPGYQDSQSPKAYRGFLAALLKKRSDMLHRSLLTRQTLCGPIKRLHARFDNDFAWLNEESPESFLDAYALVNQAYDHELEVIEMANRFIERVLGTDLAFDGKLVQDDGFGPYTKPMTSEDVLAVDFVAENIRHRQEICKRIDEYVSRSEDTVRQIEGISWAVDSNLTPIEDASVKNSPGYTPPSVIAETLGSTPQNEHRHLYTLLAFGSGIAAIVALLVLVVILPMPSPYQEKVFGSVLALGAAGFGTTLTGLLNANFTLGKQLVVGGTGALAIFLIVFFFNPASPSASYAPTPASTVAPAPAR